MTTSISASLLARQLEHLGFAILPPLIDAPQIDALCDALGEPSDISGRGVHARRDVLDISLVRQMCDGSLGDVARQVLGDRARPVRGLLFDKVPGANWKVPWHQDISIAVRAKCDVEGFGPWSMKEGVPHVQPPSRVLEAMLTLRLHLDPCPLDNGPLRVLPGSHRSGKLSAEEIQGWRSQVEEEACEVERGGLLMMKPLVLHASSASSAPSHRRVLHIEWANTDLPAPLAWFYE